MSLLAIAATAVLAAGAPSHDVKLEHRGSTYRVSYRPVVVTSTRSIGMSAGPRPSTQRCVVSARVSVERVIAGGTDGHELRTTLPQARSYDRQLPGTCQGREDEGAKLVASKAPVIATHLSDAAVADRAAALAAIDAAHHFAAN